LGKQRKGSSRIRVGDSRAELLPFPLETSHLPGMGRWLIPALTV
jgi:hypothetical protein